MNKITKSLAVLVSAAVISLSMAACSPEVGSEEWCNLLKEKPKGDWTANEATDFAKHCLFGGGETGRRSIGRTLARTRIHGATRSIY